MKSTWVFAALASTLVSPFARAARPDVVGYFWVPDKDTSPYWTLADHADTVSTLAPTWLNWDAAGHFNNESDPRLLTWAKARGIRVTPLFGNSPMNAATAHSLFKDPDTTQSTVSMVLKTVKDLGADGINIDIEGVAPADRALYNAFIDALCTAFHAERLLVTADLPAKTADSPTADWAGFADYAFLAKRLDQMQLMCYDEHWSSGTPGPIASIPWVRKVLQYATTVAPSDRVVLGMPFYGYDWPPKGSASEVTGVGAQVLLKKFDKLPERNTESMSLWFTYEDPPGSVHTVYYEDAKTLSARLGLAKEFKLAGVSIWRLGDETPDFWSALKRYRRKH